MKFVTALILLSVPAASIAGGGVIMAARGWAAIDRGQYCEARGRSLVPAQPGQVQATAGFTFSADRRRWGEFSVRLSRVPRAASTVMLTIGGQPFLLVPRGNWAWSASRVQDQAILELVRTNSEMRVDARDRAGRRIRDRYQLGGAPAAIDAAAAHCAGKMR